MNDHEKFIVENKVDAITSLIDAIYLSGGRISWYEIKDKTLEEIINTFAINGIRFYSIKHYKDNE